jgi:hypothetical protein
MRTVTKKNRFQQQVQKIDSGTAIFAGNDAMIAADASEESKSPNQKEGEPVSEEDTAEQPSVP